MLDYEEIRKAIAIAHNVLLDKDDSALVMVTLNDLMFQHYSEHLIQQAKEQNGAYIKAIETALQKSVADAKQTGANVINDATAHAGKEINKAVTDILDEGMAKIKRDLNKAWYEIQVLKKVTIVAAGVSCFSAAAAMGAWISILNIV